MSLRTALVGVLFGCVVMAGGGGAAAVSWAGPPTMEDVRALMQEGEFGEAAAACAAIVEQDPENGEAWFLRGYTLHMDGQLRKAARFHRRAAEFPDFRGIALYNLGCAYAQLGEHDEAIEALEQASEAGFKLRESAPGDSDLESLREDPRFIALLQREPADWQERIMAAVQQVGEYIAEHAPGLVARLHAVAEEVMGVIHEALAQFQGGGGPPAALAQEQAMVQAERPPTRVPATQAATMPDLDTLMEQERWGEAARVLRQVVEEDPDNGRAWFMLGYTLHADGQLEAAVEIHQRAAKFEQFKGVALYNLGCAYALQGKTQKAYGALRRAHRAGFDVLGNLGEDSDLESLRRDSRFRGFMEELEGSGGF